MNYFVSWTRFVRENVFADTAKPKHLAWLRALLSPAITVYTSFIYYTIFVEEDLMTTPQVAVLRGRLNDKFDISDRRILILDGTEFGITYMFLESENQPLYLPVFIGGYQYDFEVHVPAVLRPQEASIRAFLDRHKLAGKTYVIVWIP